MPRTSTSNAQSLQSAQEPVKHWREPFDELKRSFQDYHARLDRLLGSSSPGSQGVPDSLSSASDSQTT